jgi:hypothetical protein
MAPEIIVVLELFFTGPLAYTIQFNLIDYSFTPILNYPVARFSIAFRVGSPQRPRVKTTSPSHKQAFRPSLDSSLLGFVLGPLSRRAWATVR